MCRGAVASHVEAKSSRTIWSELRTPIEIQNVNAIIQATLDVRGPLSRAEAQHRTDDKERRKYADT
jgi:hypothetical protein